MTLSQNAETINPMSSLWHWKAHNLFLNYSEILKSLCEQRDHIVQIPYDSIVRHGENGSLVVFVYRHCNPCISDPHGVLNLAGDADRDYQSRARLFARKPN